MTPMPGPSKQKPRESVVQRIDREEREVHAARVAAAKQGLAPARAQAAAALEEQLALRAEVDAEGVAPLDWAARVVTEDWPTRAARYGLAAAAERLTTALGELIQSLGDGQTHRGPCGVAVCRRTLAGIDELSLEDVATGLQARLEADAASCVDYPRHAREHLALARSEYALVTDKVARRLAERGPQPEAEVAGATAEPEPDDAPRPRLITNLPEGVFKP